MRKRRVKIITLLLSAMLMVSTFNGLFVAGLSAQPLNIKPYIAQLPENEQRYTNFWPMGNFSGTAADWQYMEPVLNDYLEMLNPNCVDVWLNWNNVEKVQGVYDFTYYDLYMDKLAANGTKISLRLNVMDMPSWFLDAKDGQGRCIYTAWDYNQNDAFHYSSTGGTRAGLISFANETARNFVLDFVEATVQHFKDRYASWPYGNPIRLYSTCFSDSGEMEYTTNPDWSNTPDTATDYSPAAKAGFRSWLKKKYASISLLNQRWGASYSDFDAINDFPCTYHTDNKAMDWLEYRAYEQGRMIKDFSLTIKGVNPNAQVAMVFGSVYDSMIRTRGSLFADYWTDYVDYIGCADSFHYNHRYSMSTARGLSKGKSFYNEAFRETWGIPAETLNNHLKQGWDNMTAESFNEGANQMNYAAFWFQDMSLPGYDYFRSGINYLANNGQQVTRPKPTRAIYMSTWTTTRDPGTHVGQAESKFNQLRSQYGFVDVIRDGVIEDADYIVANYTDIHFVGNEYISDTARAALLDAQSRGVTLHDANSVLDKFGNARLRLDQTYLDNTAPSLQAAAAAGYLSGIASDVGSGIKKIVATFADNTSATATGTDTWTINTQGKSGTVSVVAYDNNNNVSSAVQLTIIDSPDQEVTPSPSPKPSPSPSPSPTITPDPSIPPASGGHTWEFNENGNTEGWGAWNHIDNLGVNGGYLSGNINGNDPYIVSSDNLNIDISTNKIIKIKMKNATSSTSAKFYFLTNADSAFDENKSVEFTTIANDSNYTEYILDLSANPNYTGTLKRLRLDPMQSGSSGSFSIDYIDVGGDTLNPSPSPSPTPTPTITPDPEDPPPTGGYTWDFNENGNREGWIPWNHIGNLEVSGGYLNGNIIGNDPYIISDDNLGIDISNKIIKIKMKNSTSSTLAKFYFTTNADTDFDENKSVEFTTIANDSNYTEYIVDMSVNPNYSGTLRRLRLDPMQSGSSGEFSIDYIDVGGTGSSPDPTPSPSPSPVLPPSGSGWEFNNDGNTEGWYGQNNVSGLHVGGGVLTGTITGGDPQIATPSNLGIDLSNKSKITIRLKNNTSESYATLYFSTAAEDWFTGSKAIDFQINPNSDFTEYTLDFSSNPYFTGTLHQLRFDPNISGSPGTFSIDYIRIT